MSSVWVSSTGVNTTFAYTSAEQALGMVSSLHHPRQCVGSI
jgi:hypothetical protein